MEPLPSALIARRARKPPEVNGIAIPGENVPPELRGSANRGDCSIAAAILGLEKAPDAADDGVPEVFDVVQHPLADLAPEEIAEEARVVWVV
jgi:hypothetical protein